MDSHSTDNATDHGQRTLVLLCHGLDSHGNALGLPEISRWLQERDPSTQVETVEDLCDKPKAVSMVADAGAFRLVLGLCSEPSNEPEMQSHARKAKLDPLGIETVNLGLCQQDGHSGGRETVNARAVLAAAVARVRAFPGSRPENVKTRFLRENHKLSRRALFTLPPVSHVTVPTIDGKLCVAGMGCKQCVTACPYKALSKERDTISVDRTRCQSCAACVPACPHRAVEFPGWSPQEVDASLSALLEHASDDEALLFYCKGSPPPAAPGWLPVRTPDVAGVPVSAILQVLAHGASAVALYPCEKKCGTVQSEILRGRVDYCGQLLGLLGDSPERVQLLQPDAASPPAAPSASPARSGHAAEHLSLFGRRAPAVAVSEIAKACGASGAEGVLKHTSSPLGIVNVDSRACTGCGSCATSCPTSALLSSGGGNDDVTLTFDHSLCTGCGLCVFSCPEIAVGAIGVSLATDLGRLSSGAEVVFRDREASCQRCGARIATRRTLERIASLLEADHSMKIIEELCPNCRGLPRASF